MAAASQLLLLLSLTTVLTAQLLPCNTTSTEPTELLGCILGFITPQGPGVSDACRAEGTAYLTAIATELASKPSWAVNMLDSSANFPPSGAASDANLFHHPGTQPACLAVRDGAEPVSQYCLLTAVDTAVFCGGPSHPCSDTREMEVPQLPARDDHVIPDREWLTALLATDPKTNDQPKFTKCRNLQQRNNTGGALFSGLLKIGKCLPKSCNQQDIVFGGMNYLSNLGIEPPMVSVLPIHCQEAGAPAPDLDSSDIAMLAVVGCFAGLVLVSTLLDLGVTVLELSYLPTSLLPILQGFSAYHNIMKIMTVGPVTDQSNNLACINGLKYISITWIVLGHVLWEYCIVSAMGAFSASVTATGKANDNIASTAVWNGLMGVDSFFVIGGCLLAFHTLKEPSVK